jgi:hypothetical protein
MNSKFNVEKYGEWMNHFASLLDNFNLVLFTNEESYKDIVKFIHPNVKIVIKEYTEFICNKWDWEKNHKNNYLLNNQSVHNTDWRLNMVWSEKINFVNEGIKYFNNEYCIWCDIGYFRTLISKKFPNKNIEIDPDKVYYALVCPRKQLNTYVRMILLKQQVPYEQNSIAGGFFLSHIKNIEHHHKIYYTKLEYYFLNDMLVKDDQYVLLHCFVENMVKYHLIEEPNPHMYDKWFVFQRFLT